MPKGRNPIIIKEGEKYGTLTAVSLVQLRPVQFWIWQCDCGMQTTRGVSEVKNGRNKTCGYTCSLRKNNFKHGYSNLPEYNIWTNMHQRVREGWKYYGDRGVSIHPRWNDFINFLEDMGRRPSPEHTLERLNNDGHYEPSNCKWATWSEQLKNRRPYKCVVTRTFTPAWCWREVYPEGEIK